GFHMVQRVALLDQLIETRQQVVARDNSDAHRFGDASTLGRLSNGFSTRGRIDAARVRDDTHAAFGNRRPDTLHRAYAVARVSHFGIALFLLLQNAHRDFGEIVEHQVVYLATFGLPSRRLEPVAPEALSGGHADDLA